ncbi:hypothetical protein FRC09_002464 [Ceratobasidium sp. 395]|nr:hypothetical protein FRC09_002464 [Ceratobasidium sp. 395]
MTRMTSLRDKSVRAVAEDTKPYALAAAKEEDRSDDDGELIDATKLADEQPEDTPEHLPRAAIISYALSMIKQYIDTVSPLPRLWNHILAICLSSSAASSATNTSSLPWSSSVYRNVVGPGFNKAAPELLCRNVLARLVPTSYEPEDDCTPHQTFCSNRPPHSTLERVNRRSKHRLVKLVVTRSRPHLPRDLFSDHSDGLSGVLFPVRAMASRPVAHLFAELGLA